MQTITIQANESFLKEAVELLKNFAKKSNEEIEISFDEFPEYESRFDEYLEDIEAFEKGELEVYPLGTGWKYLK
ncbi:MAG: hypothetical protein GX282_08010 [Campylobacteraceae bacterium]|nr:hypothetical protein [Campylobacteraceae bacterium]